LKVPQENRELNARVKKLGCTRQNLKSKKFICTTNVVVQPESLGAACLRRLVVCSVVSAVARTRRLLLSVFLFALLSVLCSPLHSLECYALLFRCSLLLGTACSGSASIVESLFLVGRLQNLETAHERIINTHHGSRVVKFSAVVGRRE